jgi:cell division protein FtsB
LLALESRVEYDGFMEMIRVWGKRLLVVVGLLVLIFMVLDFNTRMARLTHLRSQKEIEEQKLNILLSERAALRAQIAYVTSDKAVEEWARQEGRMMMSGDFVVVPIGDSSFNAEPVEEETTTFILSSNWDAWMHWLFYISP